MTDPVYITRNRKPVSSDHKLAATTGGRAYHREWWQEVASIIDDDGEEVRVSASTIKKYFDEVRK